MNILEPVMMGFDQIRLHKLRATLSILGILVSVGSVTGIVSMGDGLRLTVMKQFEQSGGTSQIRVNTPSQWYRNKSGRWVRRDWEEYITNRDVQFLREEIPDIRLIIPVIFMSRSVRYRSAEAYARIRASNEYYHKSEDWDIKRGRFISNDDVRNASKVAVIGPALAEDLYGKKTNPVGKEVKIEGARYQVIGVLSELKFFGDTNERHMVIPVTTAQKRFFGNERLNTIIVQADSPEKVNSVAQRIRIIIKRHHEHGEDFQVRTGEEEIGRFNRVVTIMKIVAGGIAGISLLVGGIGIMNIMLVSVTERTREIGVRKALGAKRRTILYQFILESIVLCLFGGILGVLLGLGIGAGISAYVKSLTDMPFESIVTPGLMIFAVLYSVVIGLFFGVYPAYRASKLDPIEALRYE